MKKNYSDDPKSAFWYYFGLGKLNNVIIVINIIQIVNK